MRAVLDRRPGPFPDDVRFVSIYSKTDGIVTTGTRAWIPTPVTSGSMPPTAGLPSPDASTRSWASSWGDRPRRARPPVGHCPGATTRRSPRSMSSVCAGRPLPPRTPAPNHSPHTGPLRGSQPTHPAGVKQAEVNCPLRDTEPPVLGSARPPADTGLGGKLSGRRRKRPSTTPAAGGPWARESG